MLRRMMSLLLALVMVFGMVPTAALATEETTPETVAETTEVVVETTEAEAETTEAPEETTEPAVETTEAEEETQAAVVETTEAEETTPATEETELTLEAQMEAAMALARAATSGSCGDALTWSIAEGTLTISGTGDMYDYSTDNLTSLEDSPWRLSEAPFTAIVMEEGITSIGDGAFMGLEAVTTVTIPVSLQSVGAYAFSGCTGLTEVIFPNDANGLKGIGIGAFADCYNLTVSLPISVTYVDETAFAFSMGTIVVEYAGTLEQWLEICEGDLGDKVIVNCSDEVIDPSKQPITGSCGEDLTWSLDRQTGVLTITGTGAMTDYNDSDTLSPWHNTGVTVTGLVVEEGVESIGAYAFVGMSGLKEVTLPGSVTEIGDNAFASCTNLTKVTMNEGTTTIGGYAFADCEVLAKVIVPESMESIADTAFSGCPSYLTVEYPGTQEEWDAIYSGPAVTVTLPTLPPVDSGSCGEDVSWSVSEDGVLTITGTGAMADYTGSGDQAPWNNTSVPVTSIVVEEGVTALGDYAFAGLESLEEITLPESLAEVGSNVFMGCESLTSITFTGDAPAFAEDAFTDVTATVNYPQTNKTWSADVRKDYGGSPDWNAPEIKEEGNTSNGLSWTLNTIGELVIDGNAESIPADAFANRTDITTVVLPDSVTSIGDGAFSGCTDLEEINLDNVTDLGKDCFKGTKARIIVDISENPVYVNTQTTQLTYTAPAAVKAGNIRWEITSTTSKSCADITADGILHVTNKLDVTVRCYDSVSGAWDELKIHSEYVPVIVEPILEEGSFARAVKLTENAEPAANDKQLSKYAVYLDKEDVSTGTYTFDIRVLCADPELDLSKIKFSSTNSKVAAVKGTTVTVKKKADGAAVILAQVMEGKKTVLAEGMLSIYVREYTPRLDATALTLNTLTTDKSVTTGLVESYGNVIKSVKLEGTEVLTAAWEDGILTVKANGELPKGTIKPKLVLTCYNAEMDLEKDYPFNLKVTVKNTAPAITAKQSGKFDLFYVGSEALLKVTAKNAVVTDVKLADCDFTVASFDAGTGMATIKYADTYTGAAKADAKGNLLVTLEGYAEPVKKAVTISTVTSKPKLALTASSSVINTALVKQPVTGFAIYDPADGQNLVKYVTGVTCTKDFATYGIQGLDTPGESDDGIILTLNGTAGGTATVEVKRPEWAQSVKLTHKVTVNDEAPKVKLAVSTITLDPNFPARQAGTYVQLDQSNLVLGSISGFTATGKNAAEAEKISLVYEENVIFASFKNPADLPENGTYTFSATPTLADGTELGAVTLKVKVAAGAPVVKLSASSVKLNKALAGEEVVLSAKITKNSGDLLLAGFAYDKVAGLDLAYDKDAQTLTVKVDKSAAADKYTLSLQPIFEAYTGEQAKAGKAVKLTVQVYDTDAIKVSISNKGKLDAIVPDSAIVYTVKKISNAMGTLDGVSLYGQDADKFDVVLEEVDGVQTFKLTMKPGQVYNTKTTYKVGFLLSIGGIQVEGPEKTVKVSQSKLKFSVVPKTARYYQSQSGELDVTITLTAPEGASLSRDSIKVNAKKTAAAFIRALGNGNTTVNTGEMKVKRISEKNGQISVDLSFDIRNSGNLTPGKSFAVVLDITPDGNAENVAPTQLKLTVKAYK
nr:leucine-rich repeat domain-containing protein [Oscillospiraceae bacterium]